MGCQGHRLGVVCGRHLAGHFNVLDLVFPEAVACIGVEEACVAVTLLDRPHLAPLFPERSAFTQGKCEPVLTEAAEQVFTCRQAGMFFRSIEQAAVVV